MMWYIQQIRHSQHAIEFQQKKWRGHIKYEYTSLPEFRLCDQAQLIKKLSIAN